MSEVVSGGPEEGASGHPSEVGVRTATTVVVHEAPTYK